MKNLLLLLCLLFLFSFKAQSQENKSTKTPEKLVFMIRHTVAFKLNVAKGSYEEREYFNAAKKLSSLPSVHNFAIFLETSKTNDFDYLFYMEFESINGYEEYNKHPVHVDFVDKYWRKYVDEFIEIDYQPTL